MRLFTLLAGLLITHISFAQSIEWGVQTQHKLYSLADVTYLEADGYESKLDAYVPRDPSKPLPTLL